MGLPTMGASGVDAVMVAEQVVRQGLTDLRGELGIKFNESDSKIAAIDTGLKNLQNLHTQTCEDLESLSDTMTEAFKRNNALLRSELKALSGDIQQTAQIEGAKTKDENAANIEKLVKVQNENVKKQIDELEKNINTTLENIKQNGVNVNPNRERNDNEYSCLLYTSPSPRD